MDWTVNLANKLVDSIKSQRRRVLVVGDAMLDVWIHGYQTPCQDGCDKFVQRDILKRPGGAANAYECLTNWNANVESAFLRSGFWPIKTRFVDERGRIVFRWDDESVSAYPYKRMCDETMEWVSCASGVLISDYDKGFLSPEFIHMISQICHKRGIPCVADCKRPPSTYPGCIRKGNRDYLREHGGLTVCTYGEGVPEVDGDFLPLSFPPVNCVNHVGAGDCFSAHLILALTYGFSLKEASAIAHSAGRVYVQYPHNRPPHPNEIASDLHSSSLDTISTSIP